MKKLILIGHKNSILPTKTSIKAFRLIGRRLASKYSPTVKIEMNGVEEKLDIEEVRKEFAEKMSGRIFKAKPGNVSIGNYYKNEPKGSKQSFVGKIGLESLKSSTQSEESDSDLTLHFSLSVSTKTFQTNLKINDNNKIRVTLTSPNYFLWRPAVLCKELFIKAKKIMDQEFEIKSYKEFVEKSLVGFGDQELTINLNANNSGRNTMSIAFLAFYRSVTNPRANQDNNLIKLKMTKEEEEQEGFEVIN
ncbi:MAG: hypothetical protein CfP315_0913 [Candidatus Improbicoccus pseudotrichonymphae]|uniref:Uncharacterized protein n=1 Tax=Candidatus Improbicoccus pseudotrichonymphae TaxID=3033792 RepID=A0AA48I1Z6_9FIRM|nr:MAG: hypothetical protein CfP315_0913 [Candidatus Improbicoccus pseudotrichonymphae]